MNKKTIIFVIVFVLAFGAASLYFSTRKAPYTATPTPATSTDIVYTNDTYGFSLTLPADWKGYTLVPASVQYGYAVTLRHPLWTAQNPYMDIPILIYPIDQWKKWEANHFEGYPTAAPIGPTERGRNTRYVFATAPRYNFSFGIGWEAVDVVVQKLKAF